MTTYRVGDHTFRRKNLYRPCIMVEAFDKAEADGDDAELARLFTITKWSDNITGAEWPAVLREPGCSPSARSRLKGKAAGWIMALWRIAALHPELFEQIVERAETTYAEQVQTDPRVVFVWDGAIFVSGEPTRVGNPVDWHPEVVDDVDDDDEPEP